MNYSDGNQVNNNKIFFSRTLDFFTNFFQIDIRYFISGGTSGILQQVVGIMCGAIVTYLIGHFVHPRVFGEFNLVLSTTSIFLSFSLPGIDTALTRSIAEGFDNSLWSAFQIKVKSSLLGSIALVFISIYYLFMQQTNMAMSLLFSAIAFPFFNSLTVYINFLVAKKRFSQLALFASIGSIFYLLVISLTAFFIPTTLGLITAYSLGTIIPALLGFTYALRLIKSSHVDPHLFKYGLFLTGVSALPWITGNAANLILGNLIGVSELALYSVAIAYYVTSLKFFTVFYKPVTAKMASSSKKHQYAIIRKHGFMLLGIGLICSIVLWIFAPFYVSIFYNHSYEGAKIYSQWVSLIFIPLPLTWILNDIAIYQKRKKAQILFSSIPQIIKIVLLLVTIPIWGISAAIGILLLERFISPLLLGLLIFGKFPHLDKINLKKDNK